MKPKNKKHKKVDSKVEKSTKKGLISGQVHPKITKTEADVLHLLTEEFLTPRQASIRRKKSKQAIYKTIQNLKKKGYLTSTYKKVDFSRITSQPRRQIRLHRQEFNIKIIFKDHRYERIRDNNKKVIIVDGNTIRLYRDSVEVYSGHSFFGSDVQKATARSFEYWNRFFVRLENDLNVILVKSRKQNITLVNQHYAEVDNELAVECEKKAEKIRIFTRDDGKLWF